MNLHRLSGRRLTTAISFLLCFGVMRSWQQQDLFFDPAPDSRTVREGDEALLRCDVSLRHLVSFYWTLNGRVVANGTRRFQDDSNLRILNADRVLDAGSFRCVAVNVSTGIAVRSGEARLNIVWIGDRPEVVEESAVSNGSDVIPADVRLLCHVDANPEPTFDWFRNKVKLAGSSRMIIGNRRLTMTDVSSADNGVYSCSARNEAGSTEGIDGFILTRYDDDSVPRLNASIFTRSVIVKKYSSAVLNCQYLSGVATDWYFNQLHLANTTKYHLFVNGTLVVNGVDEDDTGAYQCVGVGKYGTRQTFASLLLLAYLDDMGESSFDPRILGPVFLPVGAKFEVRCKSPKGLPAPKTRWLTPLGPATPPREGTGRIKESTDGTLSVGRLEESDAGDYVCRAENMAGSRSRHVNIIVSIVPRITKHPSSQSIVEGDSVSLKCEFLATPSPATAVTWKKDGQTIDLRSPRLQWSEGHLKVVSAVTTDEGEYTCVVASKGHSPVSSHGARLRVSKRLQFRPRPSDASLELNSRSNVTCHADGMTPPVVAWHRVGRVLPSHVRDDGAGALVFDGVTRSDAGLYVCLASNSVQGTINATIRIDHFRRPLFVVRPGNVTAAVGKSVLIDCFVDGEPTPTIHWDHLRQSDTVRFKVLSNGSLFISRISEEDSGRYRCVADNIGGSEEQDAYLLVQDVLEDPDSSMVKIAVIVVCAIVLYLGLMIAVTTFCLVRKMKRRPRDQETVTSNDRSSESSRLMRKTEKDRHSNRSELDSRSQSSQNSHPPLPKNVCASCDLPPLSRQNLHVLGLLGKCHYGDVYLAHNLTPGAIHPLVSIKSITSTSAFHQAEFQREMETLSRVSHKNIARLTGVCCNHQPPIMVIEYCEWGDLKQFILGVSTETSRLMQSALALPQQLDMVRQIAAGMDHLSANRLVHGDLAARNVLVTPFLDLKITVLALCRDVYAADYVRVNDRSVPLRWTAPETLFPGPEEKEPTAAAAADVWAFGVTVTEIFGNGTAPVAWKSDEEVLATLKSGGARLHTVQPPGCPETVWGLVQRCTACREADRPAFSDITRILETMVPDGCL